MRAAYNNAPDICVQCPMNHVAVQVPWLATTHVNNLLKLAVQVKEVPS